MTDNQHLFRGHLPARQKTATSRTRVSRAQTAWFGYAGCVALYALVFSLWQVEPVPFSVHALGILIAALCLFPFALWTARGSRQIPAFELVCVAYMLAFSSPLYLSKNQIIIFSQPSYFTWDEIQRTLILSALGISALMGGYYLVSLSKFRFQAFQLDLPMHPQKRLLLVKVAFALSFALIILRGVGVDLSAGVFNSLVGQIQNLSQIAIVILGYRVLRGQESPGWRFALYGAVALASLFGLMTGMLETAILPVLLLVIVQWNVSRKFPFALFAVGLCVFAVLNSVKIRYRDQAWRQNPNSGITERLGLWVDLTQSTVTGEGTGGAPMNFEETFRQSMGRFDLLHTFAHVSADDTRDVPYYDGQTYGYLFYGWIPRFIWPDKPIAQSANVAFAVDYRFMSQQQTATTMIGIGHLPESYANFGALGILFVMTLQGMFLSLVNKVLNGPYSEGGKAIYLSIMIYFLNGIASSTVSLFMSIPLTIIISSLILRFFATGWCATPVKAKRLASPA